MRLRTAQIAMTRKAVNLWFEAELASDILSESVAAGSIWLDLILCRTTWQETLAITKEHASRPDELCWNEFPQAFRIPALPTDRRRGFEVAFGKK